MTNQPPHEISLDVTPVSNPVHMTISDRLAPVVLGTEQVRIVRSGTSLFIDTTAAWNSQPTYIPKRGDIIVYSDHDTVIDGGVTKDVPGVKIGDGLAYLIDLPFTTDGVAQRLMNHINNSAIHVSAEDREFWDNKLNCDVYNEELILNRL